MTDFTGVAGCACRSGLVKGYYDKRYQLYADHKVASILAAEKGGSSGSSGGGGGGMMTSHELDEYHSDVMQLACEFGHTTGADLPVEPTGNVLTIAKNLFTKYAPTARLQLDEVV